MSTNKIRSIQTAGTMLTLASLIFCLIPHSAVLTTAESRTNANGADVRALTEKKSADKMRISEAYGKVPLSFEPNQGQADRKIKFLARGPNYALLLTQTEAVLSLQSEKGDPAAKKTRSEKREVQSALLRMKLMGANTSPKIDGRGRLQGKSNYLIGNDRKQWRTDIPTYSRVHYDEVYPGIDLVYYGNQQRLEYDFIVASGADPNVIRLSFDGAEQIKIDADGSLRLQMKGGEVIQPTPVIYQKSESGDRQTVGGHYVLKGANEVVFELAEYDRNRELVIDPQLLYATFYGGSDIDSANDIAVDASGQAYITGTTSSPNLLLRNAYQGSLLGGPTDVFVVKFNPGGSEIIYATYLGATDESDEGTGIAITSDGKACVTGNTFNNGADSDFPTTSNRFQGNGASGLLCCYEDAILTVFTPNGNDLVYSTLFRGASRDEPQGIAVDAANKIYITGKTLSDNLPTKNAFQNSKRGDGVTTDAFIAKFDPAESGNSSLIYSTFLGGNGAEIGHDIAVTPAGVAFVVGVTGSFDYPTQSPSSLQPLQTLQGGINDGFIAKVSPSGALIYSTYFGGNGRDEALGVDVDSSERAYVTGFTESSADTFNLKNAFDTTRDGPSDAFVAKLNADGTALFYSSFLGGANSDTGRAIAIDAAGNAYIAGSGTGFPEVNGLPPNINSGSAFVAKIEASDVTGTTTPKLLYSDTFGGNAAVAEGIALDTDGGVYIAGQAKATFQTKSGAFQGTFQGGNSDGFVVKIDTTFPDSIGLFRPTLGQFLFRNSNTSGRAELTTTFGQAGDQPLAGDWDGDGVDDPGVFRNGQFLLRHHIRLQAGVLVPVTITMNFGLTGDRAVVGDWNGDGVDTPGVFRNGQWLLTNGPNLGGTSPAIGFNFNFGAPGDLPVAGDWNGDGVDTIGVRAAGTNLFALRNFNSSGPAAVSFGFGFGSDLPYFGDWDGDGIDTVGVFRDGAVFLQNTNTGGNGDLTFTFGQSGDVPVAGDWNGRPDPFTPPNTGINNPSSGGSGVGQFLSFTTTCSDPDGWHDIATIDFKIARSDGYGNGIPIALWVQFNENTRLMSFYDPDSGSWQQGYPGTNVVLSSRFAELHLADATVLGSGPTGPSVQITWPIVFKNAAIMNNYKQYLMITDDAGLTTGFDKVGSWTVTR